MKTVVGWFSGRTRVVIATALVVGAIVGLVLVAEAEPVPRTFAYQGVLTDDAGTPITGAHAITIRVYADASTGTALCTEAETVTVTNGLFRMTIGDGGCTVDPTWFTRTAPVYLEVTVDTATLTPRTPLLPVASAYQAEHAETAEGLVVSYSGRSISVGGTYCGATAAMSGSLGGYSGAKTLCQTACGDPAAHMCSVEEVVRSLQLGRSFTGWFSNVTSASSGTIWINDCQAWTSTGGPSNTQAGPCYGCTTGTNYDTCNNSHNVACCL